MNPIFRDIVIVLLTIGCTYFMTIKVKFAKDEKQAKIHAISFVLDLCLVFSNAYVAYLLIEQYLLKSVLDRESLFRILFYSFVLFHTLVTVYIRIIIRLIASGYWQGKNT